MAEIVQNVKIVERRDIYVILEFLNDNRTKFCIVSSPSFLNQKREKGERVMQWLRMGNF